MGGADVLSVQSLPLTTRGQTPPSTTSLTVRVGRKSSGGVLTEVQFPSAPPPAPCWLTPAGMWCPDQVGFHQQVSPVFLLPFSHCSTTCSLLGSIPLFFFFCFFRQSQERSSPPLTNITFHQSSEPGSEDGASAFGAGWSFLNWTANSSCFLTLVSVSIAGPQEEPDANTSP